MSLSDPNGDGYVDSEAGAFQGSETYAVKLPVFEGPLDLLLHLIRHNEVEIREIPVALIGEQYLDYLELMRELNIDVAGEYLVMAATLALMKSRMLLPPADYEEGEGEEDPRAELVARLLEYRRYKEAAEKLATRRLLGRDVFPVMRSAPEATPEAQREIEVGLFDLLSAFRELLDAAREPEAHEVEIETITVRDRMVAVMERLAGAGSIEFARVFDSPDADGPTRAMLVATFLAILELARVGALRLYQGLSSNGAPEGPIRLRAGVDPSESAETGAGSSFSNPDSGDRHGTLRTT